MKSVRSTLRKAGGNKLCVKEEDKGGFKPKIPLMIREIYHG